MKKMLFGLSVFALSLSAKATSQETNQLIASVSAYSCEEILNVLLNTQTEMFHALNLGYSTKAEERYEQTKAVKALLVEKCLTPAPANPEQK
ncbi:MAG: hypothetical protein ACXVB4_12105 [Pseudobdellovibrionaceae bacterium]